MNNMKQSAVWFCAFCFLLWVNPPHVMAETDGSIFESSLGDYREELQQARAQGKQGVVLMLGKNGCPFCARMRETVLNKPEVSGFYRKHFLLFYIDMDDVSMVTDFQGREASHKAMSAVYNPLGTTPVFVYLDLEGKVRVRYIGASSGVREFMWWGEYIVNGEYRKTNFTRYKKLKKLTQGQL